MLWPQSSASTNAFTTKMSSLMNFDLLSATFYDSLEAFIVVTPTRSNGFLHQYTPIHNTLYIVVVDH